MTNPPSVLFLTHETISATPVARAMFESLVTEYITLGSSVGLLSAGADETVSVDRTTGLQRITFRHPRDKKASKLSLAKAATSATRLLWQEARNYDVLFARSYPMTLLAAPLAKLYNKTLIFDTRGLFFHELYDTGHISNRYLKPILSWIERSLISAADGIICVSNAQLDYYISQHETSTLRDRSTVILNGAPTHDNVPKIQSRPDEFHLCYVGSLSSWHLPERTLRIYRTLEGYDLDTTLHMITPDIDKAHTLVSRIPCQSLKIYSHNYRKHPLQFDMGFCLIAGTPAKTVCFPVKFAEYATAKTPVLLSDNVQECKRLLRDYNLGFLVTLTDSDSSIAQTIATHLTSDFQVPGRLPRKLQSNFQIRQTYDFIQRTHSKNTQCGP